ncbi:Glycosyl hydrolases family 43 [Massilia sp. PDC64]|nr:glycoside hydrolase family 43 protein [Massilia sp. PDC64]SDF48294.1 Glycosyl hydrolases family 43 [Massilia sp. PDC64]
MKRRTLLATVVTALGAAALGGCAGIKPTPGQDAYVFAYFIDNGQDGLHLAGSTDGYRWEALNGGRSYVTPTVGKAKLMRDPCIVRGPDGIYHMVWTSGWNETGIGYASSPDLIHWSAQRELPVMAHEPTTLNAWAPEIAWDEKRGEYLIFWSSTIPGRFPESEAAGDDAGANKYNHRIYATTTRDFVTFTPTRLFYDPGFSVIDATFLRTRAGDWLLVKDETRHPPRKYLQLARAAGLQGPFEPLGAPISPAGLWTEGPTALQVGDDVIVYYDAYTTKHYGALRSRDLVHWEDVTAQMHFPDEGTPRRMRHGTALQVPADVLAALRRP